MLCTFCDVRATRSLLTVSVVIANSILYPQWFEDDGTPIRKAGCPNGSLCRFAHPSDENWDRLPRQVNRPIGYGSRNWRDSTRRDDYRERDSPPRSRYRSPSRSRSPHSHRRSEKRRISRSTARSRSADKMDVDYPRKDNNDSGTLRKFGCSKSIKLRGDLNL